MRGSRRLLECFRVLDRNGDGTISRAGLARRCRHGIDPSCRLLDQVFDPVDLDGSGCLDYAEVEALS